MFKHVLRECPRFLHAGHWCLFLYLSLCDLVLKEEHPHCAWCWRHLRTWWPKCPHHPHRFRARPALFLKKVVKNIVCLLCRRPGGAKTTGRGSGRQGGACCFITEIPIRARSALQNWCPHGKAIISVLFSKHIAHSFCELKSLKPQCGLIAYDFLQIGHSFIFDWMTCFKYR